MLTVCWSCHNFYNPEVLNKDNDGNYHCPTPLCNRELIHLDDRLMYIIVRFWDFGIRVYPGWRSLIWEPDGGLGLSIDLPDLDRMIEEIMELVSNRHCIEVELKDRRLNIKINDDLFNDKDNRKLAEQIFYNTMFNLLDYLRDIGFDWDLEEGVYFIA